MLTIPEIPNRVVTRTIDCPDTGVKFLVIDRNDIPDMRAASYLFQFTRIDVVKPGELTQFIISHEDVECAIEWFGAKHYRYRTYENASFTVERMGIDFVPYRSISMVIGY